VVCSYQRNNSCFSIRHLYNINSFYGLIYYIFQGEKIIMKDLQNNIHYSAVLFHRPRFLILVMLSGLTLCAFLVSACSGNLSTSASAASIVHVSTSATTASTATGYPVKVFFSRFPESVSADFSTVYPVDRISPTIAVGTFALQLLIAGPTLTEQQAGYFTELNTMLSGPSNCSAPRPVGGPDFTLTLDKKGTVTEPGTATVKFCRSLTSPGIGADARVKAEINATLTQFPNIKKVVILTKDGHCFADESGKDFCLN
jgi:Sporulation and spore germination